MANNPLMERRLSSTFEPGSDTAAHQLQDHCDRLNRLKGDRYWFVTGEAPSRTINNGPRQDQRSGPYATPGEVAAIMRQHGL